MLIVSGNNDALTKAQERLAKEGWETKLDCWARAPASMPGLCVAFANVPRDRAADLMTRLNAGSYGQLNVRPIKSVVTER